VNAATRIAVIAFVVLAAGDCARSTATSAAAVPAPSAPPSVAWEKQIGSVAWLTSYTVAMEKALLTRRPLLVTFYTDWCGWCRKLERTTFVDPGFVGLVRFAVPVRLNGDREKGLAALLRVSSYPTSVLLNRRGKEIGRIVGYRPPEEFSGLLSSLLAVREPLAAARAAADAHPADADALYDYADALLAVGQYEEARAALAGVAALSSARAKELSGEVALDGALTHLFAHEYAAALPKFEDYLERFPQEDRRDQALFFYGTALIGSGNPGEGVARLREAAETTSFEYIKLESDRLARMAQEGPARGKR
jgi:thiol-disulfide isomerase/thioredoxin